MREEASWGGISASINYTQRKNNIKQGGERWGYKKTWFGQNLTITWGVLGVDHSEIWVKIITAVD